MDSCIRLVRTIVIKKQGRNHIRRFISISMKDKLPFSREIEREDNLQTVFRKITLDQEPDVKLLGRVSRDLTDIKSSVLIGEVGHHQSPVVGVAVG